MEHAQAGRSGGGRLAVPPLRAAHLLLTLLRRRLQLRALPLQRLDLGPPVLRPLLLLHPLLLQVAHPAARLQALPPRAVQPTLHRGAPAALQGQRTRGCLRGMPGAPHLRATEQGGGGAGMCGLSCAGAAWANGLRTSTGRLLA